MSFFVSVAVEKTAFYFDKLFDYKVPADLSSQIEIGCFVVVPFGENNEFRQAVVIKLLNKPDCECKAISKKRKCYPVCEKVLEFAELDISILKGFRIYSLRVPFDGLCTRFKKKNLFTIFS